MRCVDPAGFPHKWLYVISMHSLRKRQPDSPLFNYVMIWGVMKRRRGQQIEAGAASIPERCSSW